MKTLFYWVIALLSFSFFSCSRPFAQTQEPYVVISADRMNVLYVGIDNSVSISVAGYPPGKIVVTTTGIKKWEGSDGKYIAYPMDSISFKEATITVAVKMPNGTTKMA